MSFSKSSKDANGTQFSSAKLGEMRKIDMGIEMFAADVHIEKIYKCIEDHCNKNILRSSQEITKFSLDLLLTLIVTTLESIQRATPTNVALG